MLHNYYKIPLPLFRKAHVHSSVLSLFLVHTYCIVKDMKFSERRLRILNK